MNLGDNLLLQDISLLEKLEAEQALILMRYMFSKETVYEKKVSYLHYIDKLEAMLISIYAKEMDARLTDQEGMSRKLSNNHL